MYTITKLHLRKITFIEIWIKKRLQKFRRKIIQKNSQNHRCFKISASFIAQRLLKRFFAVSNASPRRGRRWKRKFGERVAGWIAATARRLIVSQINRTRRFLPHCDDKAPCMFIGCLHHRDARCASRANNVVWTECSCLFFFAAFLIRTVASCAKRKWEREKKELLVFSKRSSD